MKSKYEITVDIWKSHPDYLGRQSVDLQHSNIAEFMANLFCPGPYYYYIIDSPTLSFDLVSPSTKDLLGIAPEEFSLKAFMNLVHPDDLDFFFRCEDVVAYFLKNCISPDKVVKYKITYCLRERTINGDYRLFLMQTITLRASEEGALLKVFGTHTDINHITSENNRKLSFIGLYGEPSYLEIDVFDDELLRDFTPYSYTLENSPFTKREIDVIKLLGLGCSTDDIALELNISMQTVMTHRKNILKKSPAKNTAELVADCIRKGII